MNDTLNMHRIALKFMTDLLCLCMDLWLKTKQLPFHTLPSHQM